MLQQIFRNSSQAHLALPCQGAYAGIFLQKFLIWEAFCPSNEHLRVTAKLGE